MAIKSYFYNSVGADRTYSATDFASAFDIITETGVLVKDAQSGALGFDIGGTNYSTIYEGQAMIEGHFVEVTETETLIVPAGSYSGQIVIQLDNDEARTASLVVKMDRTPIQTASFYELPLYDATVANGIITAVTDVRTQGGAVPNNHNQSIATITGLQAALDSRITWATDPNGIKATMGKFAGTGKPVVLFLTTAQPAAVSSEHRVWIQIDNF
jgi:hypothetical protein